MRPSPARAALLAGLVVMLQACASPLVSPISKAAGAVMRDEQAESGSDAGARISKSWQADADLARLVISVSVSNGLETRFRDRYAVLLAGEAPSLGAKQRAIESLPTLLDVPAEDVRVIDRVRVVP